MSKFDPSLLRVQLNDLKKEAGKLNDFDGFRKRVVSVNQQIWSAVKKGDLAPGDSQELVALAKSCFKAALDREGRHEILTPLDDAAKWRKLGDTLNHIEEALNSLGTADASLRSRVQEAKAARLRDGFSNFLTALGDAAKDPNVDRLILVVGAFNCRDQEVPDFAKEKAAEGERVVILNVDPGYVYRPPAASGLGEEGVPEVRYFPALWPLDSESRDYQTLASLWAERFEGRDAGKGAHAVIETAWSQKDMETNIFDLYASAPEGQAVFISSYRSGQNSTVVCHGDGNPEAQRKLEAVRKTAYSADRGDAELDELKSQAKELDMDIKPSIGNLGPEDVFGVSAWRQHSVNRPEI